MTFIAAAIGIISQDYLTAATGANLTIDNNKVLKTLVNGF